MDVLSAIAAVVFLAIRPPSSGRSSGPSDHRRVCITDADSRWTAALFQSKLQWLRAFVDALPTHVSAPAP